jgi:hypothetical protein
MIIWCHQIDTSPEAWYERRDGINCGPTGKLFKRKEIKCLGVKEAANGNNAK